MKQIKRTIKLSDHYTGHWYMLEIISEKKTMNTYEIARSIILAECEEFDSNPKQYIKSLGWSVEKYSRINELKGDISFDVQDIENLKSIIDSALPFIIKENGADNVVEIGIAIRERNSVSDFECNFIAGKIQELYPKL